MPAQPRPAILPTRVRPGSVPARGCPDDERVNSPRRRTPRPALRRLQALCVLGLLAGLPGMHGLAPGGGLPGPAHARQANALPSHMPRTHMPRTHTPGAHMPRTHTPGAHTPGAHMPRAELMPYGHCAGGHVQHADTTCASGAVGGGPVLSPLVPDPVPAGEGESAVRAYAVVDTEGARPRLPSPSLSFCGSGHHARAGR
jgi:hypothetical protein